MNPLINNIVDNKVYYNRTIGYKLVQNKVLILQSDKIKNRFEKLNLCAPNSSRKSFKKIKQSRTIIKS